MKEKMSPSTKFLILLFIIPILLWRCESEENLILEEKRIEEKSFIKTVENVTIDALSSELKKTFINSKREYKSKSEKYIYYDFNNIIKMVDTLGNTKYSIVFQLNNQPKNVLYNLIVNRDNNNREFRYVMKYIIDNIDESNGGFYNFYNFKGTIERYSYENILKSEKYKKSVNNKSRSFGVLDTDPCLILSNTLGSGTSYSSSSSSGGGGGYIPNPYQHSYGGVSTLGIGTFPTYPSFPVTKVTGLTTGPLTTHAGDPIPCNDLPNYTFIIDPNPPKDNGCDDGPSPINPKCIGKKIDENGNCVEDDPCNKIKKQLSSAEGNIKPSLKVLKGKVNYPGEKGYVFIKKIDGTFINHEVAVPALEFDQVNIPTGNGIYAAAHTHTDELFDMFSWSDIHTLLGIYSHASSDMKSSAILYLIARKNITATVNVYAIIVSDFIKLKKELNKDIPNIIKSDPNLKGNSSIQEVIEAINNNLGENYRNSSDLSLTFLNFFKNHGIRLFKGESDLSSFSELIIDTETNKVIVIPCK